MMVYRSTISLESYPETADDNSFVRDSGDTRKQFL